MRRTTPKSCVMNNIPIPSDFWIVANNSKIWACMVTSKAVVGSSAINKSGLFAKAIAIIIRCRWPPESWWG